MKEKLTGSDIREKLVNAKTGLGMAALGRPGYMTLTHATDLPDKTVEGMREHAFQMLDLAWSQGIRYYDVPRSYGKGEEFLASWLHHRQIDASEIVIGSKWGYVYTADWQVNAEVHEIKYHTLENLERQWAQSQELMGSYLNIYHIHSATLESGVLEDEAVLEKLYEIRESGVVVGLSLTGPHQAETLKKALTIERDGELLFQSVQATWNLLEQSAGPMLVEAHGRGCFVIIKEAMANGRLTSLQMPHLSKRQISIVRELCSHYNLKPDQLAMNIAQQQSFTDVVLSGAANREHLQSNLQQTDEAIESRLYQELAEDPKEFWKTRKSLQWT